MSTHPERLNCYASRCRSGDVLILSAINRDSGMWFWGRRSMLAERNKAVVHRIYEVLNSGQLDLLDGLATTHVGNHVPLPGISPGTADFKAIHHWLLDAFPDMRFTVEDLVAEGDRVAARWTMRGTHRGWVFGLCPSGR